MGKLTAILVFLALPGAGLAEPSVSNVVASREVGLYDKFEVTFDVSTVAENPYWPYDPQPACNTPEHPDAIRAGIGVTVDGLFLPPGETDWDKAVVQPAFYYQDYESGPPGHVGMEWIVATGNPCWKIRFAPTKVGEWRFKIRVTDRSGTSVWEDDNASFICYQTDNRGFVRVSSKDYRYFETSDGQYLHLVGTELPQYVKDGTLRTTDSIYDISEGYPVYAQNGINLFRVWWCSTQAFPLFGASGGRSNGDICDWDNATFTRYEERQHVMPGQLFSFKPKTWNTGGVTLVTQKPALRGGSTYRFSAFVKTVGLETEAGGGVFLMAESPGKPQVKSLTRLSGDTDWTYMEVEFSVHSYEKVGWVHVAVDRRISGNVYFTRPSVNERLGPGVYGPNVLRTSSVNPQNEYSQYHAWRIDYMVETARRNNAYLKVVLQDKIDHIFRRIGDDGQVVANPLGSDGYVYGHEASANRVYQTYFWRYVIARYGYATSIHSFEFTNEGNPNLDMHAAATQAMAKYFKDHDPNQHLVTTSNWNFFPTQLFWANPEFPDISYADWHRSIGPSDDVDCSYYYGWYPFGSPKISADYSLYLSPPGCMVMQNDVIGDRVETYGKRFPIAPGHRYTVTWWVRGENISRGDLPASQAPAIWMDVFDGWNGTLLWNYRGSPAGLGDGSYDWTQKSYTFTSPDSGWYFRFGATINKLAGKVWFDDIELYDLTNGERIEVPGGDCGFTRTDYDTAIAVYDLAQQVGWGEYRQVRKPVIDANAAILGNVIYGDPYKGFRYTCENQQLVDDAEGVWFRKFLWAQLNPSGVYNFYYWNENIAMKSLWKYSRAYQSFMADIPLSNGLYQDARAASSDKDIRAWGQKDLVNGRAHLWIDNAKYTWKAVVDHYYTPEPWNSSATYAKDSTCGSGTPTHIYKSLQNSNKNHPVTDTEWWQDLGEFNPANNPPLPPPVSGTVTISGFADGPYRVEWWDTSSGVISRTENVACIDGNITLSVSDLQSDIACKVYPASPKLDLRVLVPSAEVKPGQVVTITVEYTNSGEGEAREATVNATVPPQMEYVPGSAEASGGIWDAGTSSVTWIIDSVPPKGTGTRTFQARVR